MNHYPTDAELEEFIASLEKEQLYAPEHLKENILECAERHDFIFGHKRKQAQIQMFTYSIKIVAGMAAALFLLFAIPKELNYNPSGRFDIPMSILEDTLQKGSDALNETPAKMLDRLNNITNLFVKEENN